MVPFKRLFSRVISNPGKVNNQSDVEKESIAPNNGLVDVSDDQVANRSASTIIVAVHGLGGHCFDTWKHDEDQWNWIQCSIGPKLLEETGIHARVMCFGYDSNMFISRSTTNIEQVAQVLLERLLATSAHMYSSPSIIFIAHSLGGLVVKKTLNLAWNNSERYGVMLQHVRGCVFLGVPHRGADLATWATLSISTLKYLSGGFIGNAEFAASLQRNSSVLWDISRDFVHRAKAIQFRTFHETEKVGNKLIVDRDSAIMNLPNEIVQPLLASNHQTICKFARSEEQRYQPVYDSLKELVQICPPSSLDIDAPLLPFYQMLGRFDYEDFKLRIPSRHPQTCEWFLGHEDYHSWRKDQDHCLLWLSLDPGCGKSVLLKHLADSLQLTGSECLCYFFFKSDGDIEQRDLAHAFSAILHQVFSAFPAWINFYDIDFKKYGTNISQMGNRLMRMFMDLPKRIESQKATIICLLDGVDECEEHGQRELLDQITNVLTSLSASQHNLHDFPKLKFLIASRPYPHIEQRLRKVICKPHGYHIDGGALEGKISREIKMFTTSSILQISKDLGLKENVQSALINRLTCSPEQTYLWVSLILTEVTQMIGKTEKKALSIINGLPKSVNEAYEKILSRAMDSQTARKVLALVLAAERPLTLSEIDVALEVSQHTSSFEDLDMEGAENRKVSIRHVSGLFLTIRDERIYFIHETARSFLLQSEAMEGNPTSEIHVRWYSQWNNAQLHTEMTDICVRFLSFKEFGTQPLIIQLPNKATSNEWTAMLEQRHSWDTDSQFCRDMKELLDRWTAMVEKKGSWDIDSRYRKDMKGLLNEYARVVAPLSLIDEKPQSAIEAYIKKYPFLAYAATHWLQHVRKAGLQSCIDVISLLDERSPLFQNWFSIYWGTEPRIQRSHLCSLRICMVFRLNVTLEALILKGADLNTLDHYGSSALHFAAQENLLFETKLLLAGGASPTARDCASRTVLHDAVVWGSLEVAKVLLESGHDPNASDWAKMACLHLVDDNVSMTRLLVSHGADVNQEDMAHRLPIEIVLYDCGWNDNYETAEDKKKCYEVIEYLMECGTSPAHALRRAYFEGDEGAIEIVERVLEISKIASAAIRRNEKEVLRLLESGVDPNARDYGGSVALHYAAAQDNVTMCGALLRHGANIDEIYPGNGNTPLLVALMSGKTNAARFLIENGANKQVKGHNGRTALTYSARLGDDALFQSLLQEETDLDCLSTDERGACAMLCCVFERSIDRVNLLLDHGANIDIYGLGTPLVLASERGPVEMVKTLLDRGASMHRTDHQGRTALHLAIQCKHLDIVKLLVQSGHSLWVKTKKGKTIADFVDEFPDEATATWIKPLLYASTENGMLKRQ